MTKSNISEALDALSTGRPVIAVDDAERENEGDVILSAALATPQWIAWTVNNSSGFICAPMSAEIADALRLPAMVEINEDPRGTAYTVTVDAADCIATGISAVDRAHTLNVLANPMSKPSSLHRPGHILPLRAKEGGVLERPGHTEAAVDLMKLAGLPAVAAISEIVRPDGALMRLGELEELGRREQVPVVLIADLVDYLSSVAPPHGSER